MPHIHTEPGQIDFCVDVFVVYKNTVLFRFHDKHKMWLMPGGHIELNEVPEQAAVREVFEEVGLEVELYNPAGLRLVNRDENSETISHQKGEYRELLVPSNLNIHYIQEGHRHVGFVYFAKSKTNVVVEPQGEEKSGGCIWLTKEEIVAHPEIQEIIKNYALKALEVLGEWR